MEKGAKLTLKAQSLAADEKRTSDLLDLFYCGLVDSVGLKTGFQEIINNHKFNAKKRYTIATAHPQRRDLPNAAARSAFDYEKYMIKNHGYERKHLVGSIGYGTKNHTFSTVCKVEGDVLYIASCYSFCGSAKWSSQLTIFQNQQFKCDCQRCKK